MRGERRRKRESVWMIVLVLLALAVRLAAVLVLYENLSEDRDAYRSIARNLTDGAGFVSVSKGSATAFRPPLYPVILFALPRLGGGNGAIAALHVLLGTMCVVLTVFVARRLNLGQGSYAAGLLVAVDPLLVGYTTFVMTETLFVFLVTLLLTNGFWIRPNGQPSARRSRRWRAAGMGFTFGLCALCRPTIWVFAVFIVAWWAWQSLVAWRSGEGVTPRSDRQTHGVPWLVLVVAAVTLAPWVVRNLMVFGKPIVTTTHGGYTLLLGNNPVFYREVVAKSWGTVWDGNSLSRWQQSLELDMARAVPPVRGEVARDRWMYHRALHHIAQSPGLFVRACVLRFCRFWSFFPEAPVRAGLPAWLVGAMGLFYTVMTVGVLAALCRLSPWEWKAWAPLILCIVAFTLVHTVYWSNMRMRAPVIPAIVLLATRGLLGRAN